MTPFAVAWWALLFWIGASIGSFLNVCIARWPVNESVVRPRSKCPNCGAGIAWYDNIPLLSWLILRAKCRHCQTPISPIYPAVEILIGLGWVGAVWWLGPTFTAVRAAVFFTILVGIAITDVKHYLIPDGFTVTGLLFAFASVLVGYYLREQYPFAGPADALFGACVGAGAITIIGWLGEVALKKEAMGFGDSTLMAMVGASLGSARALLTIFAAAALAAVVFLLVVYPIGWMRSRARGEEFEPPMVPFGVFLAPAALLMLVWGKDLLAWYLNKVFG